MSATPATYVFSAALHGHLTPFLAALHGTCIVRDHLAGTFLPPLDHGKLLAWWKDRMAEAAAGAAVIALLVNESQTGAVVKGTELVGAALLSLPAADETSPFRARVDLVLVRPDYRGNRGAAALVAEIDRQALARGKTLLMTDAESGSVGEAAMKKLGYIEVGRVPQYAFSPADKSSKRDHTILYKKLSV